MNAIEIRNALSEIQASVGPKADCTFSISHDSSDERVVYANCSPNGICGNHRIYTHGEDFESAIASLREKVAAEITSIRINRTREMARQIIETTFDHGSCSDAALRGHGFSKSEIDMLGDAATKQANSMADSGPFSISKHTGRANASAMAAE